MKKLAVSGYEITPEFRSDVTEYILTLPKGSTILKADDVLGIPTDEYATVVKDGDLDLTTGSKIFNIDVTSHDGSTHTNYKIKVQIARSDNNYLEILTTSHGELSPKFDKNKAQYTLILSQWEESVTIDAVPEDNTARIYSGAGTYNVQCGETKHAVIVCQAENEELRAYMVDIVREPRTETRIMGTVITENEKGKHSAKLSLYKGNDLVETVNTKEDGSYEFHILPDSYKLVIEKDGYLTYTVDNIELLSLYDEADLGEYNLIAGDVVKTGEIEIDDLVWLNRRFGYSINSETNDANKKYDLNEDGVIDDKDVEILVRNYSKRAEVVYWKDPNQPEEPVSEYEDKPIYEDMESKEEEIVSNENKEQEDKEYDLTKDNISNNETLISNNDNELLEKEDITINDDIKEEKQEYVIHDDVEEQRVT